MTLFDAVIIARLPFGDPDFPAAHGELVLFSDATVRMVPAASQIAEFEAFTGGIEGKAVAWGSSLIVGLGAIGALLWMRNKRGGAWAALAASGIAGVVSGMARGQAGQVNQSLLGRHRLGETATVRASRTGGLIFSVREPNLPPWSITLGPDDFDSNAGSAFLRSLESR